VLPTQTTVMAWGAGRTLETGVNFLMVVHGEQRIRIHAPLSPAAAILADWRVASLIDKGAGKGAILVTETHLKNGSSGAPLATLTSTIFARGDGGFGGPTGTEGSPPPHPRPEGAPDAELALPTRADQALLYRLSGDRNPLHADPGFAQAAGFPRPILHGLCTYAITCRAVLQTYCDYDPFKFVAHDARFSAPVYPGETIVTRMWRHGTIVSFEASVAERPGVSVVKNGRTELAA
jgi:acyl dehydratase